MKKRTNKKTSRKRKISGETLKIGRRTSVPYLPGLLERLENSDYAAGYLGECLLDTPRAFLLGLRNVVLARGGVTAVAKETSLTREHLYRMLSDDGNPRLSSLLELLDVLSIELRFQGKEAA